MMDVGVLLKVLVVGVVMGLVLEDDGFYVVLIDIFGDEDYFGDMDFKVVGIEVGIILLQMDIKVQGIMLEIMVKVLVQVKQGCLYIFGEMVKVLIIVNEFLVYVFCIEIMQILIDKICEVIGLGGKVICEIVEILGVKVDINDDGVIKIVFLDGEVIKKVYDMIYLIVVELEEGKIYKGKVVKLVDFGVFVNFFGKCDGLVYVFQIENCCLNYFLDVLKEGQEVWVKLLGFDDCGKVCLLMKVVDQEIGEEVKKEEEKLEE